MCDTHPWQSAESNNQPRVHGGEAGARASRARPRPFCPKILYTRLPAGRGEARIRDFGAPLRPAGGAKMTPQGDRRSAIAERLSP